MRVEYICTNNHLTPFKGCPCGAEVRFVVGDELDDGYSIEVSGMKVLHKSTLISDDLDPDDPESYDLESTLVRQVTVLRWGCPE